MPKRPLKIAECRFVALTSLLPRGWNEWFWCAISDNAPFSWGDNDHTLVTAERFARHCEARLDDSPKVKRFLRRVRRMRIYIDLET